MKLFKSILLLASLSIAAIVHAQNGDKLYVYTNEWQGKLAEELSFTTNYEGLKKLAVIPSDVEIIAKIYSSFTKKNEHEVANALDNDVIWNDGDPIQHSGNDIYKGKNAVMNGVFNRLHREWKNWNITELKVYAMAGNTVLSTGRYKATCRKNGGIINAQFAHLWTINDGKVTNFKQYIDTKQIADVMNKY
ncbi:MAG: nuclear transport factor 2 family protein [Leeuwenhoekiella sp.]